MKQIESRKDVRILVDAFYHKIRSDEMLGPIFNHQIPADKWPAHLVTLTDFWETNLFGVARFKGNPSQKHVQLDHKLGHTIAATHFERWLELWCATVGALFTGERAEKAKSAAARMGSAQFYVIQRHREVAAAEVKKKK